MDTRRRTTQIIRTRLHDAEYIVVESPIPASRALGPRRPLSLALGSGALVVAIWVLAVLGSAGSMATAPLVLPGAAAARVPPQVDANVQPQASVEKAPVVPAERVQQPKPQPQPLLQSRSSAALPPLSARADGRTAVSASPSVLVVYVPPGYYPEPEVAKPPTREAAQQTANIVQQVAAGNNVKAVEQAQALRASDPKYAASVATDLQKATQPTPRYNEMRQVLIALDPAFATRVQPETQTRTQVQPQTQTQVQPETKVETQTAIEQGAPVRTQPNAVDRSQVARQVNALVMGTVPAYVKMPFGMNEGTLQVNTLVAPTPAFLFNQAQIRSALCLIGAGEVVAVHDTIPNAWELKTTFIPKDPVRWFTVRDAYGKLYYLPNYLDAARDVQVGDRFAGC